FGGTFVNRSRFLVEVIREVIRSVTPAMGVVVKMNLRDGFKGGMELDDAILTARLLEREGVNALVLSGGFVSKSPMYILRGSMPVAVMARYMKNPLMKLGVRYFGKFLMKSVPYNDAYFLEDAMVIRREVKLPLILVGGLKSKIVIEDVLDKGFDFVQIGRALINDPAFINKLQSGEVVVSGCECSNVCIARMYSGEISCIQSVDETD
ncbi:MAG: NADH:flavin oxidoreductase, partial [Bacteroidota bacterium]